MSERGEILLSLDNIAVDVSNCQCYYAAPKEGSFLERIGLYYDVIGLRGVRFKETTFHLIFDTMFFS